MKNLSNRETTIIISDVKKRYRLGQIGGGTLQADLQSWWARVRKKEDPNTIIGQEQRLVGQTFMALNGINLEVYRGEALGIIGGNGAGKSTLLKLLSRVTAPTEGRIDLYGRVASMLEVGTGFNGDMTGRENIYMNGAILGMTKAEIDSKMDAIIEFSEVKDFIDTPVKRYSSGMYVKLAFSVAAHLDSEIIIMDEVLAVGDVAFQNKCIKKMRESADNENRTVLYVSHNMNTIQSLCDRCIVLDKGKIIYDGDVAKAIDVYLNRNDSASGKMDFTSVERENYLPKKNNIRFISSEYLNNNNDDTDMLYIKLKWKQNNIEDFQCRIEFSARGVGVATCVTPKAIKASLSEIILAIDTSSLVPENYELILTGYRDLDNLSYDLDCVHLPRYRKELTNNTFFHNWNYVKWGHVKMPDIQVM